MIKRIVGLLAATAVLAVIVFTLLGSGTYSSFIERRSPSAGTAAATPAAAPEPSTTDTLTGTPETERSSGDTAAADSLSAGMPVAISPDSPADSPNR